MPKEPLSRQCECAVANLTVSKGHVGDWWVQIVFCEDCGARVATEVDHQSAIDSAIIDDRERIEADGGSER